MSAKKVLFEFDPFEIAGLDSSGLSARDKRDAASDVADFLLTSILEDCADQRSPVTGRPFAALSKDYKAAKEASGSDPIPNLELSGDLLGSLIVKRTSDKVAVTVPESKQGQAYGLNSGYEGHPFLKGKPARKFIPLEGETFRPDIRRGIKDILTEYLDNSEVKRSGVETE